MHGLAPRIYANTEHDEARTVVRTPTLSNMYSKSRRAIREQLAVAQTEPFSTAVDEEPFRRPLQLLL